MYLVRRFSSVIRMNFSYASFNHAFNLIILQVQRSDHFS
ncbi:protein of unknown function [Shewanella benthica]|uniref:Uncharacterized protein n=1 Tax=Shewanella benthica TaxID=43661 RepID=A0A330M7T3_9GAMM|nr:protein of unknown function [Shewanella benthica]